MSELRDRYDREAVSGWITQPPLAALEGRARHRRHRNRVAGGAGVALLAALVAVPLLIIQGGNDGTSAGQSPSFPPSVTELGLSVEFYDPHHGFATYSLGRDCAGFLSVTRDTGSTWSELRPLPGPFRSGQSPSRSPEQTACLLPRVIPVTAETLVIPVTRETRPGFEWVEPPAGAFISRDAGQTWQEYQPEVRTVDTLPEGVVPEAHCEDDACREARVGWYDPETGDRMVLRDNPPAIEGGPVVAADSSIWTAGAGTGDEYQVSVSRDRGHSWQTEPVARVEVGDPANFHGIAVATTDGRTGYVSAWESTDTAMRGSLYRTTDGGATWQRAGQQSLPAAVNLWVAPDGTVVADDGAGGHHASGDRGETFQDAGLPPVWDIHPITGGYFGGALDDAATDPIDGYLSDDGLTWRPVRAPRP